MKSPEFAQRISLGDVITAIVAIIAAAGFAYTNAGDIRVQAERISAIERERIEDAAQSARDSERLEARLDASLRDIKESINRVEDKIDSQNRAATNRQRPQ
jgi:uncharacterized protein HemX